MWYLYLGALRGCLGMGVQCSYSSLAREAFCTSSVLCWGDSVQTSRCFVCLWPPGNSPKKTISNYISEGSIYASLCAGVTRCTVLCVCCLYSKFTSPGNKLLIAQTILLKRKKFCHLYTKSNVIDLRQQGQWRIHDFGQGGSGVLTPGGPWAQNRGFSLKNAWKLILKKSWGQGGGWAPRAPWIRYCWLWLISCISNVFLTRRYSVEKHIFHVLMSFLESKW